MAQSTGRKAIPRDKSLDLGEQFDLAGEGEEPPRDKGKNRARADSLSSLSDKGDGDSHSGKCDVLDKTQDNIFSQLGPLSECAEL
jgi:hypothetical protein